MNNLRNIINASYKVKSGGFIRTTTNRSIAESSIATAILDVNNDVTKNQILNELSLMIKEDTEASAAATAQALEHFTIYDTPKKFLNHVFEVNKYTTRGTGDRLEVRDERGNTLPVTRSDVETKTVKLMYAYNRSIPSEDGHKVTHTYLKDEIMVELDDYIRSLKLNNVTALRRDLVYNPNIPTDSLFTEVLNVLTIDGDHDVNLAVLKHFIWCIKRHIFNLPVKSEIWLALFGGQGVGKNYFVNHVFAPPLSGTCVDTGLDSIANIEKEMGKFQNNFLINFDELAKGNGSSGDSSTKLSDAALPQLKAILTRDELHIRKYHTQDQMILAKNFACMSTANIHIYDVIDDPTGMRRFFEMNMTQPDGVWLDHEAITELAKKAKGIYRGIDENNPHGYVHPGAPEWKAIQDIQNTYKSKSSIDYWMEEGDVDVSDEIRDNDEVMTLSDLYSEYKAYAKDAGSMPFSKVNFNKALERRFAVTRPGNKKSLRVIVRD